MRRRWVASGPGIRTEGHFLMGTPRIPADRPWLRDGGRHHYYRINGQRRWYDSAHAEAEADHLGIPAEKVTEHVSRDTGRSWIIKGDPR